MVDLYNLTRKFQPGSSVLQDEIKDKECHCQVKSGVGQHCPPYAFRPLFAIKEYPADRKSGNYPEQRRNGFENPCSRRVNNSKMGEMGKGKSCTVYLGGAFRTVFAFKTMVNEAPVHKLFAYWTKNHADQGENSEIQVFYTCQIRG